jgi:membrane-associated phospholipid phosphatase
VEATAAAIGFSTLLIRTPLSAILSVAWALLIMYSRIVLGVHNFTDILAGIMIGCLGLLIIRRLFELRPLPA